MSDIRSDKDSDLAGASRDELVVPPSADVEPLDAGFEAAVLSENVQWYEDGGRKTALGVWAGTAVLAYAAMQVSGYLADWPFVALVAGAVTYFGVRGIAVVLNELHRRRQLRPQ